MARPDFCLTSFGIVDGVVDCRPSLGKIGLKSRRDEVVRLGEAICPDWLVSEKYKCAPRQAHARILLNCELITTTS
jgi:hypothetical protein